MSDLHIFWLVLARDPYLFLGLLLIGVPTVGYWYMYRKLSESGFRYKSSIPEREPNTDGRRGLCT
jgi:hypothetical protein